jgi:hypothetical protein
MESTLSNGHSAATMRKVILVGTAHKYQHLDSTYVEQFRVIIRSLCQEHSVMAMAEEMSQYALKKHGATQSVMQKLSAELGIRHQLSDPSKEEREQLGIRCYADIHRDGFIADWEENRIEAEVRRSHDIREHYWLEKLCELNTWPIVFVCGKEHVEYFSNLLRNHEIRVVVAFTDWKPFRPDMD